MSERLIHDILPRAKALIRSVPLLVVVEGPNDIEFLKRISTILHAHDERLPDLRALEVLGKIIFLPTGGGGLARWTHRLAGLRQMEFHLYDREIPPQTCERQAAVAAINRRPGCVAALTAKRAMENYLHRHALLKARGVDLLFHDGSDVPELLAQQMVAGNGGPKWEQLSRRSQKRVRNRAKRWLNTEVVERMTPQLLAQRDPQGEVVGWLRTIAHLTDSDQF